ncbi:uncharacterized protein TRAVEDRAFT_42463, partial [Trametes versicolor FP-101664 SS1]|uniref:uncharacterized protein n=1 Tax=Trametes versicolor (strain FP-101664) TaxID=717944 RepID=UPI00046242F3
TTVARKLTSLLAGSTTAAGRPSASTSRYSSARSELDFHPQLWLTENTSGALVKRVRLAPVALAHAIVKYALTAGRGSRYGCGGVTAGAIAGSVTGSASEPMLFELPCRFVEERANPGELGRDEDSADRAGEFGVVGVVLVRARGDPGTADCGEKIALPLPLATSDGVLGRHVYGRR